MHLDSDARITPIHANALYHVTSFNLIWESLFFDYHDPDHYYAKLTHNEEEHRSEIEKLWRNMQFFLDHEKFYVNKRLCEQEVVYLNYDHHGAKDFPYVYFLIKIPCKLKRRNNVVDSRVFKDIAQYDFELVWCFPPGSKVISVETTLDFEQIGQVLNFWGRAGDPIPGTERIEFDLAPNFLKKDAR
ncbi:MAG: hypothetical protein ACTSW4_04005 [Candidatus Ranarchaeia archaeon]